MKVQIDVDQELWRRTRIAAIEKGDKLGVFVGRALSSAVGELRAGGTDGDAQRGGSIPRSKTVKAVSITASESKNPAPSPTPAVPVSVPPKAIVEQKVMSAYVSDPVDKQTEGWVKVIRGDTDEVSARHKCAICHLSFPESEMTYHAKTLLWACNDCLEKQA